MQGSKLAFVVASFLMLFGVTVRPDERVLPGTKLLEMTPEIDVKLIEGVDRFLLRHIEQSQGVSESLWQRDVSSLEAYEAGIRVNRDRLAHRLGLRDPRIASPGLELVTTTVQSSLVATASNYEIHEVRWPVVGNLQAEGILLRPMGRDPRANVVAIPDATHSPAELGGLVSGVGSEVSYPQRLAIQGCQVLIPVIVQRVPGSITWGERNLEITAREFLYRSAFVLGRHLIGYEVQQTLAVVDWFKATFPKTPVGVIGFSDGGMLALYASAIDTRIDVAMVSGYFDSRLQIWEEPIDRNVFGRLSEFGDAQLAAMMAGRGFVVEASEVPTQEFSGGIGAPAMIRTPDWASVKQEYQRAIDLLKNEKFSKEFVLLKSDAAMSKDATNEFLRLLRIEARPDLVNDLKRLRDPVDQRHLQQRWMNGIDRHNQQVLLECDQERKQYMQGLDTTSLDAYVRTSAKYRKKFYNEVIGQCSNAESVRPSRVDWLRSRVGCLPRCNCVWFVAIAEGLGAGAATSGCRLSARFRRSPSGFDRQGAL
jgi:hypothetical protein